jgi:adenine-specific DNA-methyltransferase
MNFNIFSKKEIVLNTITIKNRRYLGNKYKLLSFIKNVIDKECIISSIADIFAGTGSVASAFIDKKIITNDILYSNYICHYGWFYPEEYSEEKIKDILISYNNLKISEDNYMSDNFTNIFFTLEDCRKIGYIREDIEQKYNSNIINKKERSLLIISLISASDKIANTCGHYDGFRHNSIFERGHLDLCLPLPNKNLNKENLCFNKDVNELVKEIYSDIIYLDPPYNSRQYSDCYHLLENLVRWEKPEVIGITKKMINRDNIKSKYCSKDASIYFEDLIKNINSKYILLSYNSTGNKGNNRSNARISDNDIYDILNSKGKVKTFSIDYNIYNAGSTNITENQERLFLCTI